MKLELSIRELFQISKKYLPLMALFIVIGMASSVVFSHYFINERYSSQAQLIADTPQTEQSNLNGNEIVNNLRLVNTYKDFVKSDMVLEDTKKEYEDKYNKSISISNIKNSIDIEQSTDSQMFSIKVSAINAEEASQIVNILTSVFVNKLEEVVSNAKVTIISKGVPSESPEFPKKKNVLIVGAFMGFLLGIIMISVTILSGVKIRDKEYIVNQYNYLVLGEIGHVKKSEQRILERKTKELLGYQRRRVKR